jgi:CDP-glycerol glycerophosphotransferase (TagB/SpsB family)
MSIAERVARELARQGRGALGRALARLPERTRPAPDGAWLLGASVGAAYNDNSAALHAFLRQECRDIDAYWVINSDSHDLERARRVGPVLLREDVMTWAVARRAAVHVISHGVHDVPLCSSASTSNAVKVRLGHGLTAMKKTKSRPLQTNKTANAIFDLVPVASNFERENKRSWDIADDSLVVTGLPRFDPLVRRARAGSSPRILYMPTWRDGGSRRQEDTAKAIVSFLQHPILHRALVDHGVTLDVYCHRNMRAVPGFAGLFRDGLIRVLPVEHDVQDSIASCMAMVTDYSSVCWDALYVDKPVLFYQFDLDAYLGERGAYFDLRNDAPGPRAETPSAAAELVANALNDLVLSPAARRWQQRAFAFRDDQNCRRVYTVILERLQAA